MIKLFENYNKILEICIKYGIRNWSLNSDGNIDVSGNINLSNMSLTKLPIKFSRVTGWIDLSHNNLTTLKGAPISVGGNFYCSFNKLTTLEGVPREVSGLFSCSYNNLTTLKGAPREVGGGFYCNNNKLTTLEGCPREVSGDFYCYDNNLPVYFNRFMDSNDESYDEIIKQILKWQDEYELWKDSKNFEKKFRWMMEDIQENDLPHIKIKFP